MNERERREIAAVRLMFILKSLDSWREDLEELGLKMENVPWDDELDHLILDLLGVPVDHQLGNGEYPECDAATQQFDRSGYFSLLLNLRSSGFTRLDDEDVDLCRAFEWIAAHVRQFRKEGFLDPLEVQDAPSRI